jgi:hypothetical protein
MGVKELIHTNTMGISVYEHEFIQALLPEGVVCPIAADNIQRLMWMRDIPCSTTGGEDYYAYWKWQPTPGYHTTITYDDGEFAVETSRPDPRYGQLQALAYELVVFRLVK